LDDAAGKLHSLNGSRQVIRPVTAPRVEVVEIYARHIARVVRD
jgi:hypothetical protein